VAVLCCNNVQKSFQTLEGLWNVRFRSSHSNIAEDASLLGCHALSLGSDLLTVQRIAVHALSSVKHFKKNNCAGPTHSTT
jgi:hypothetical protein